jgi:hypothetical protein
MTELLAAWAPLVAIFALLLLYLVLVRRQSAAQARTSRETGDRNTRAVEENTAAVKALIEELRRERGRP